MPFALLSLLLLASSSQLPVPLNGRAAATYAYENVFEAAPGMDVEGVSFASKAMNAGGWSLPAGMGAEALSRFLDAQKGIVVHDVAPGASNANGLNAVPGDLLMADWGQGDEKMPVERNRVTGAASEFLVVQGSLGNGDFVYCRNGGSGRSQMGRFASLMSSPNLAQARYRLYHVVGNDPTHGFQENGLYRDEDRLGVFLHVNGGLFWVPDDATVKALGGWSTLKTLPAETIVHRYEIPVSGTMLRELHDVAVWMIDGSIRRHIRDDAAVRRRGGWEAVRVVPDGCIETMFPREGKGIL